MNAAKKSAHKLIVDAFQEDGVLCNSASKEYDENETYLTGGANLRKSFKQLNDLITRYHSLLKILTGDHRANIYESIPVIDFLNTDNTSLLNYYDKFKEDGTLNTSSIRSIEINSASSIIEGSTKPSLQYIIENDPHTINRAVMGDVIAEQFFNTTEVLSNDTSITAFRDVGSDTGLCYKGILSREMSDSDGLPFRYTKSSPMFITNVASSFQLNIDWDDATSALDSLFVKEEGTIEFSDYVKYDEAFIDPDASNLDVPVYLPTENRPEGFLKHVNNSNYTLSFSPGDICIILPRVAYSLDSTKIIIFKKIPKDSQNSDSQDTSTVYIYEYFICYVRDYTSSAEMDVIQPGENLPDYISSQPSFISVLQAYANVEIEYYSQASGLMNGLFCEPKYTESSQLGRKVTKWKFLNESDKAASKEASVPIGSKYFPGHLLGRGVFIPEPLRYDNLDSSNEDAIGLATHLYNRFLTQADNITGDNDKFYSSNWSSKKTSRTPITVDKLVSNVSIANTDSFKYKLKLKKLDGSKVTIQDIDDLIDNCIDVIGTDSTLVLDTAENYMCRKVGSIKDKVAWDALATSFNWNEAEGIEDTTGKFDNQFGTFIKVSYVRHKNKWRHWFETGFEIDDYFRGFSILDIQSPLELLVNDSSDDAIILWPEDENHIPSSIKILSRYDLELDTNSLVLFYNPRTSSRDGNFIGFKIASSRSFLPSNIRNVVITDHLTDPDAGDKNPTRSITVSNINTKHDCYIYSLEAYSLATSDIKYTDSTGREISVSDTMGDIPLIPLAYPLDHFKGSLDMDAISGATVYTIDSSVAKKSIDSLKGAYIINTVPKPPEGPINDYYSTFYIGNDSDLSLSVFGDFTSHLNAIKSNACKKALFQVLKDWPITTSDVNPITLGNFTEVINGLIESRSTIRLIAEDTSISSDIREDFSRLLRRISNDDIINSLYLDFSKNINIANELYGVTIPDNINIFDTENQKLYSLQDAVKSNLPELSYSSTTIESSKVYRPSLEKIKVVLDNIFTGDSADTTLNSNEAEWLDTVFGNGTQPPLIIGTNTSSVAYVDIQGLETQAFYGYAKLIKDIDKKIKVASYNSNNTSSVAFYENTYKDILDLVLNSEFKVQYSNQQKEYGLSKSNYLSESDLANMLKESTISESGSSASTSITYSYLDHIRLKMQEIYQLYPGSTNDDFYYKDIIPFNVASLSLDRDYSYSTLSNRQHSNAFKAAVRHSINNLGLPTLSKLKYFFNINKFITDVLDDPKFPYQKRSPYQKRAQALVVSYIKNNIESGFDSVKLKQKLLIELVTVRNEWIKQIGSEKNITIFPLKEDALVQDILSIAEAKIDLDLYPDKLSLVEYTDKLDALLQNMSYYHYCLNNSYEGFLLPYLDEDYIIEFLNSINIQAKADEYNVTVDFDLVTYDTNDKSSTTLTVVKKDNATVKTRITIDNKSKDKYSMQSADVGLDNLSNLATFILDKLEGVEEGPRGVRYLPSDSEATGRKDSLYYKRYVNLNSRMNKIKGPLSKIPLLLRGMNISDTAAMIDKQLVESYSNILSVVPIVKMTPLYYMKTQVASDTQIAMNGKFYQAETLEAMKHLIGENCILTCGKCTVKDSCPFYNEQEIINLYCNPTSFIDIYLKDNELDLLVYDDKSPVLTYTAADGSEETISLENQDLSKDIHNMHKPYAEVQITDNGTASTSIVNSTRQIKTNVVDQLKVRSKELNFDAKHDTTGWLLGGRYGTVEHNPGKGLRSRAYPDLVPATHKYLYNAMFIPDEETEFVYRSSTYDYPVSLDLYENGVKKTYKGTTKIKIPINIKLFAKSPGNAHVYIASDDTVDDEGNTFTPLIYLNTLENLTYMFDLYDQDPRRSIQTSKDKNIYPADVAQWSVNIAKGPCFDEPCTSVVNRDQYWMKSLSKRVHDEATDTYKWITVPGRARYSAGYQEVVNDINTTSMDRIIAGKPIVASYENFMRRISFKMYTPQGIDKGEWNIEWISPIEKASLSDPDLIEKRKEYKRSILPLMKTNLRLVVVTE